MTDYPQLLWALVIFGGGLAASFFFSGTEIGFYRVSRIKLVLETLLGCRRSRLMLWLTNHPTIFISTVLLGNNLANNFVSLGSVMLTQILFPNVSAALISTIVVTPIVFTYGELLPKSIFLQRPTRLMMNCVPLYWILIPLFLPVSLFLTGLSLLIARLLGETPRHYALQMTDAELTHMLVEGKNAGLIETTQHSMAEKIFELQSTSLRNLTEPLKDFPFVHENMSREDMLQTARRLGTNWVLTRKTTRNTRRLQPDGFYYFSDLLLTPENEKVPCRKILELPDTTQFADAMGKMFLSDVPFAILKNAHGESLGLIRRVIP
ncbi:MAG: DUF21 domain-containing protein [Planctomycetia bacterium]|nr:DUF21 domain-containing protein [Planctomycetia bacterium]